MRSKLITAAAVGAAAVGGATLANAASSKSSSSSSSAARTGGGHSKGPHTVNGVAETPLTGDVAAKVKAAALAKVPGTVERVETNVDGDAPYEAHITKADGTEVEVQVNKDYSIAAVNEQSDHHGGHGHGGPHTVNGQAEKPLTGDVAAKVKAAALAKVPGTVERVETNVDGDAPYEAHITKADGTEVEVQVNKDYSIAAVNAMGGRHP